jgi:hypothetical protein
MVALEDADLAFVIGGVPNAEDGIRAVLRARVPFWQNQCQRRERQQNRIFHAAN